MVCALVRVWDCHTFCSLYMLGRHLLVFLSLVNDLGVTLTSASFSVRSPGLTLLSTPALSCEFFDRLGAESTWPSMPPSVRVLQPLGQVGPPWSWRG